MKSLTRSSMALILSFAIASSAIIMAPQVDAASSSTSTKSQKITRSEAISIAQAKVKNGTLIKTDLDYERGTQVYEVEILDSGTTVYEFDISTSTGEILRTTKHKKNSSKASKLRTAKISADTAIATAKKDSGASTLISCELDVDDGRLVYEIELTDSENTEYDWVIDAKTGKVIDSEVDYDD